LILGRAGARETRISAVNCASAKLPAIQTRARFAESLRRLALCLLLWLRAAGEFFYRPRSCFARHGLAPSHTHTMTSSAIARCHHAVGGSIADFFAKGPLRIRPISMSVCPPARRRLIRSKRTHGRPILCNAAAFCRTIQQAACNIRHQLCTSGP